MSSTKDSIEQMVNAPYRTEVVLDTCGKKPCFVASNPELEGCMAQGETWQEAIQSLKEARRDYISAMVRRGWNVPMPEFKPKRIVMIVQPSSNLTFVQTKQEQEIELLAAVA